MIWLASGSPRRRQLLEWSQLTVEVHPPEVDETPRAHEHPVAYAERLACEKADTAPSQQLAVAADTVVHLEGIILGKPANDQQAQAFLERLSGHWHLVTTGVCVRRGTEQRSFSVTSEVRFRPLSPAEITAYVACGEGRDKAGAYGIQGRGGSLVSEVRGSWTNVMGLPVEETLQAIEALR